MLESGNRVAIARIRQMGRILLAVGNNNLSRYSVDVTLDMYARVIKAILAVNPQCLIVCVKCLPRNDDYNQLTLELNDRYSKNCN